MSAIGETVTTTIEERERYPVNVRYPRELRDDIVPLKRVLVPVPTRAQIPLEHHAARSANACARTRGLGLRDQPHDTGEGCFLTRAAHLDARRAGAVDGSRDDPVGVAIGAGTDVAVEAGDVVLVRSDPRDVVRIIALSKATYRKMEQNLWWAAGCNIVAIPLAAGVLAPFGIVLPAAVGAGLMSASTVIVAANAQLQRRARL